MDAGTGTVVRDAARLYAIIAGRDPSDSTTVDVPPVELPRAERLDGLRVGVPKELNEAEGIEPGVNEAVRRAIGLCADLGATVEECSLPRSVEYGLACYYLIAPAEASSNLARYDGMRYGLRVEGGNLTETYEKTRAEGFGAEVKRRILIGTYVLSAGYYDAYYLRAQRVRALIARDFTEAYKKVDVILTPTAPSAAFAIGENADDPIAMYLNDVFTVTVNLAGLPGISVPAGLSADGLPLGLQLIGKAFDEETLFRVAGVIEQAASFTAKPAMVE